MSFSISVEFASRLSSSPWMVTVRRPSTRRMREKPRPFFHLGHDRQRDLAAVRRGDGEVVEVGKRVRALRLELHVDLVALGAELDLVHLEAVEAGTDLVGDGAPVNAERGRAVAQGDAQFGLAGPQVIGNIVDAASTAAASRPIRFAAADNSSIIAQSAGCRWRARRGQMCPR